MPPMDFTVETRAFRAGDERWLLAALERARTVRRSPHPRLGLSTLAAPI